MVTNWLKLSILLIFFASCNSVAPPNNDPRIDENELVAQGKILSIPSSISLIHPIASPSVIATPRIRVNGVREGSLVEVYAAKSCQIPIAQAIAISDSVIFDLPSLNVGSYQFYARQSNQYTRSNCSTSLLSYVHAASFAAPSNISRLSPSVSPNTDTNPVFRVSGVSTGSRVQLFADSKCSIFLKEITATSSSVDITLSNLTPAQYSIYARSIAINGESSICSDVFANYHLLSSVPAPSGLSLFFPQDPVSSIKKPIINVTGVIPGATVSVYRDPTCQLLIGSQVAAATNVNVEAQFDLPDGNYQFFANQKDLANNVSACSSSINQSLNYTLDSEVNDITELSLLNPTSTPSRIQVPTILVSGAEPNATVRLYTNNTCSSSVIGSGIVNSNGNASITTSFLNEGTYSIYAQQTDLLGNISNCGPQALNYQVKLTVNAPTNVTINFPMASSSTDNTPDIKVSGVEQGALVRLFTDEFCTLPNSTGIGAKFSNANEVIITTASLALGGHTFYAQQTDLAGNVSACSSSSFTYTVLPQIINEPSNLTLISPSTSPNTETRPSIRIQGLVNSGLVQLFFDSQCSQLVDSRPITSSTMTIQVPEAKSLTEGVYRFYARQIDSNQNISNCSNASVEYVVDLSAARPTQVSIIDPISPQGIITQPTFRVYGLEKLATAYLYSDNACSTQVGVAHAISDNTFADVKVTPITVAGMYNFYAKQVDILGNISPCSIAYAQYQLVVPGTSPTQLTLLNPNSSPGNIKTPTIRVSGVSSGATVRVFRNSSCSQQVGQAISSGAVVDVVLSTLNDGSYVFFANQIDDLGNMSACSTASVSYVLDSIANPPSSISLFNPNSSPSNVSSPVLSVAGLEVGGTVSIYRNSSCTQKVGEKLVNSSTEQVSIQLPSDGSYTLYAKQVDAVGNISSCSTSFVNYVLDTTISVPGSLSLITPASSPSSNTSPVVLVSGVVSGNTVKIYGNSTCSGSVLGSANTTSNSVQVTLNNLSVGSYTFHANQTDAQNNISGCSSNFLNYQIIVPDVINDALFGNQWYLKYQNQHGPNGYDVNVVSSWDKGYKGSGIVVQVVDDGIQTNHPDLSPNYLSTFSYNAINNTTNPSHTSADHSHGTSVAGVIAARDNSIGVRGVAPRASISAYNLLGQGSFTAAQASDAMSRNISSIHVSNNSWGPVDWYGVFDASPAMWKTAVETGLSTGRSGKGAIYVWAAGNGAEPVTSNITNGLPIGLSNNDGYANYYGVITVGALMPSGTFAPYSEWGTNLWISAPAGYGGSTALFTTERTTLGSGYTYFAGTSASTPVVAGAVSLMLEANANLGWRDVKWILAETAVKTDPSQINWITNAAGFHFNPNYGFGRVDVDAAVSLAKNWVNLPSFKQAYAPSVNGQSVNQAIPSNGQPISSDIVVASSNVSTIEYITITLNANHGNWGELEVILKKNGSNFESKLTQLHNCLADGPGGGLVYSTCGNVGVFDFGDASRLGESPIGTWTLEVMDKQNNATTGTFNSWRIQFHGH